MTPEPAHVTGKLVVQNALVFELLRIERRHPRDRIIVNVYGPSGTPSQHVLYESDHVKQELVVDIDTAL